MTMVLAGSGVAKAKPSSARGRWVPFWLLAPAVAWITFFFLVPVGLMIVTSLAQRGLQPYHEILTAPVYRQVLGNTLRVCIVTTLGALILGYPVALALTFARPRWRALMLPLVILPYWLDYIVRSYSWKILLGRRGMVNDALVSLGIVDAPLKLLYTLFSVSIGMIQILLPLMILTLFATMVRIDKRLLDAAAIHGASRWSAFRTVFFPLSRPGIYAGCLLVFVTSLGFYITPALLGGPSEVMISQSIMVLANELLDWPLACAAGVLLLIVSLVLVTIYNRFFSDERSWGQP